MTTKIDKCLPFKKAICSGDYITVKVLLETKFPTSWDLNTVLKWTDCIEDEKIKSKMKRILNEYLAPQEKRKKRREIARQKQKERANEDYKTRMDRYEEEQEDLIRYESALELQQLQGLSDLWVYLKGFFFTKKEEELPHDFEGIFRAVKEIQKY